MTSEIEKLDFYWDYKLDFHLTHSHKDFSGCYVWSDEDLAWRSRKLPFDESNVQRFAWIRKVDREGKLMYEIQPRWWTRNDPNMHNHTHVPDKLRWLGNAEVRCIE